MPRLTTAEIDIALIDLPSWKLEDGKLIRDYTFSDFVAAMVFVNRVADLAETAGHHPDIDVRYSHVRLGLISHDSGGITRRDVALATRIDQELSV